VLDAFDLGARAGLTTVLFDAFADGFFDLTGLLAG